MASKTNSYLLLDVGGTFIKLGAADEQGCLLPEVSMQLPSRSEGSRIEIEHALAEAVRRGVRALEAAGRRPIGIGIAIPGPFDYANGIALMTHKFRSIYGLSVREMLQALPEVGPDLPIGFVHDVNAVLLGELAAGHAAGYADVAVITLGTGLGFACCTGSGVCTAPSGAPAYSIYNLPYGDGILEDYVSKRGILRLYGDISGRAPAPSLSVADLGRMACDGDPAARAAFAAAGKILAEAVRDRLAQLGIRCLLFGGQISKSFRFMEAAVGEALAGLPELREIRTVRHLDEAALRGAYATIALNA